MRCRAIAHMNSGDRVTAARVSDSLQTAAQENSRSKTGRWPRFPLLNRRIVQRRTRGFYVSDRSRPGGADLRPAGFKISRGVLKKQIPVYEENAVDDDLLNEGKRNLLDYLQTRGHFDAKVEIKKESDPKTLQNHLRDRRGSDPQTGSHRYFGQQELSRHGETPLLPADSARQPVSEPWTLQRGSAQRATSRPWKACTRATAFAPSRSRPRWMITTRERRTNLRCTSTSKKGERTLVGEVHVVGNQKVKTSDLPELSTQAGQPYSEQDLANDRERILSYYFDHGFPNATLEIATKSFPQQRRTGRM